MNEILRRRVLATVAAAGLMAIPALGDGPVDVLVDLGVDEGRAEQLLERWQDHHETSEDELVDILATAIENQAPPGLLIDKAAEGLAKSIPSSRLLPALRKWGEQIAVAAKLAEELEGEFDTEGMPMQSVVLRLHLLRRSRVDDAPGSSSPSRHRMRR
ncbi:MAG TPA: hypothetical protein QF604_16840 [Candidatus Latescibacteria bacterium]|jgi:hypothetical protein|nr:hypothetical protein [Gemmatimonadota bacterium]MDP7364868.1 hypothetical protein [Candidatus Latescibacterota bacterium]MDP7635338.1 hypothetical protein [Candidatus Latescibacterota bacterium]HCV25473.1 hypothetical protein [Candidatus Latescibacterota bacterium]HJN29570.1 hypothetical protein [Candidatus Latescibacterota bacterium]|tara:strand:- start:533 stop:1006 length:474 start_codon:yes stop_codon:yes gene_type:complete